MTDSFKDRPVIKLLPGRHKRVGLGHPWIYSNEIDNDADSKKIKAGSIVTVKTNFGEVIGVAYYHPNTLIAARMLDKVGDTLIDEDFIIGRIERAFHLREKLFDQPYYRLVHSEADGLPGVVIDRYGDAFVVQLNTQGAYKLKTELVVALKKSCGAKTIITRTGSLGQEQEGLPDETDVVLGKPILTADVLENDATFVADITGGQKTGWFYDQRDNRAFVASLCEGKSVLDVYSFSGGFGVLAATRGAKSVTLVDRSEPALTLAKQAAAKNKVEKICSFEKAEAFDYLEKTIKAKKTYDVVITDPPAFIKTKKDLAAGTKGYRKLSHLAIDVVKPGGFLFIASCSHHMSMDLFWEQISMGLAKAGRTARIIRQSGAGPDHPVHPFLPESAYLTALVLQVD